MILTLLFAFTTACTIQDPLWSPIKHLTVKTIAASPTSNSTLWAITTSRMNQGGYKLAHFNATQNRWLNDEKQPNGAHWYFALALDP